MQTFRRTCFYNDYRDRDSNRDNWRSSGRNDYNLDNYQSHSDDKPNLQKQLSDFIKAQHLTNSFIKDTFMDLKNKLKTTTKNHQASTQNLEAKFDRFANKKSGRPSGSLPSNTQTNPKDHNLWDIIVNGDLEEEPAPTTGETSALPTSKTSKQLAARRNQERVKSILLLAILDEYLLKFHNVADAKSLWEAIKSRFGGNVESKKMQKNEDINQKFLRSLPSSWNQISLIMRNKPDIDEIDIDDLYNNLRVYEDELKSATGGINQVPTTPSAHDIAYSFLAQPTTCLKLENEDFQQMDGDDLEELDLRWSNAQTTESSSQALVAQDGLGGYDWSNDFEVEPVNYALMAISSSSSLSSSDSEKVVKERDELKDKIAKWEDSTKNLDEILKSQMSARDKTGLGYSTQLNDLSSNHETDSKNSFSVFDGRSSDEDSTPANDRSSQAEGYKAVPPTITGKFLTPRADISFAGLDEYAIRNKIIESQTSEFNTKTSEIVGQTNAEKPKSANETRDDKSGQNSKKQGIGFRKVKDCFVCKSTDHLIKDCNFHDKRSQECKLKNVVNTGQREGKPVWDNIKRVNHQNFSRYLHIYKTFVPSGVLTRTRFISTARPSVSTARSVSTDSPSISTARPSVSTARLVSTTRPSVSTARSVITASPSISTARPVYAFRPVYPRMDNVRPRGSFLAIKRVKNMTTAGTRAVVNTGKGKLNTDLKRTR
ncbi:hypothetical protein Tco_1203888 [Tanacetum coccineum]